MAKFRIIKKTNNILLIERSKLDSLSAALLSITLIAIGFIALPNSAKDSSIVSTISTLVEKDAKISSFLIFIGFSLILREIIYLISSAHMRSILFTKSSQRVYINWRFFCNFSSISKIRIVEINDGDAGNEYQLELLYIDEKYDVIDSGDKKFIDQLGNVIGEFLEKKVINMSESMR